MGEEATMPGRRGRQIDGFITFARSQQRCVNVDYIFRIPAQRRDGAARIRHLLLECLTTDEVVVEADSALPSNFNRRSVTCPHVRGINTAEGEQPSQDRALRWAQTIGEAGTLQLNAETLEGLQEKVISDWRFVTPGLRHLGGFIGIHDRVTRLPIPSHISARPQDLASLISGVTAYDERSLPAGMDPVISAAAIAFGFVYIHPFEDGNERVHRWLIHHVLSRAGYNPPATVFPVSAVMLREISEYKRVSWKAIPALCCG